MRKTHERLCLSLAAAWRLVNHFAQGLAGFEMRHFFFWNVHGFSTARIAPGTGWTAGDGEAAKAANFNAVPIGQCFGHAVENGFYHHFGIAMGQVQQQLGAPAQQGVPAQPMQPAQPAPSAPSAGTDDPVERLAKLKKMFEAGLITADEFNAKKSQIIEAL